MGRIFMDEGKLQANIFKIVEAGFKNKGKRLIAAQMQ